METSARSLNHQSWLDEASNGKKKKDDTTPLLGRGKAKRRAYSSPGGSVASVPSGGGDQRAIESSTIASYSTVDMPLGGGRGLLVKQAEIRSCLKFSCIEWAFFVIATATIAGILGMSIERFVIIHSSFGNETPDVGSNHSNISGGLVPCSHWSCLNDFTFAVLILVNWLFCLYYCYGGLLRERPFEIIGYAFTVFIIFVYVVMNYFVEGEQGDIVKLIRLIISFILGPMNIVLSVAVQYHMGFLVVYAIGSYEKLTRAFHFRRLFLAVQVFNIQILANILVLSWVKAGHFTGLGEKVILPLLIIYMIAIAYLGWAAVLWEVRVLAMMWNILSALSFGYYIFKIVNIGVHWSYYREIYKETYTNGQHSTQTHFLYIAVAIIFACVLGMLVAGVMAALMLVVMGNFNKGLLERVPPPCSCSCFKHRRKNKSEQFDGMYK